MFIIFDIWFKGYGIGFTLWFLQHMEYSEPTLVIVGLQAQLKIAGHDVFNVDWEWAR